MQPCPGAPAPPPPPPGSTLTPAENPYNLQELPVRTKESDPLYPLVNGHVPMGFNDNVSDNSYALSTGTATALGRMASGVNAKLMRVPLHWPNLEPYDNGWSWSYTDTRYKAYIKEGIRPIFLIQGTPKWAVNGFEAPGNCQTNYCNIEPDSNHLNFLYDLGYQLARRYPLMAGLEYRNEPNIPHAGKPAITAKRYGASIGTLYNGARAGRASTRVIGGGLANDGKMHEYIPGMFASGAAMDALSFHPYDMNIPYTHMKSTFDMLEWGLASAGRQNIRLAATEMGAQTSPSFRGNMTWTDGETGYGESVFTRMVMQYTDLDRGRTNGTAPSPHANRIDAVLFFTAFSHADGGPEGDYGWARETGDSNGSVQPRDAWCRWRTQIAKLPPHTGNSAVASC